MGLYRDHLFQLMQWLCRLFSCLCIFCSVPGSSVGRAQVVTPVYLTNLSVCYSGFFYVFYTAYATVSKYGYATFAAHLACPLSLLRGLRVIIIVWVVTYFTLSCSGDFYYSIYLIWAWGLCSMASLPLWLFNSGSGCGSRYPTLCGSQDSFYKSSDAHLLGSRPHLCFFSGVGVSQDFSAIWGGGPTFQC